MTIIPTVQARNSSPGLYNVNFDEWANSICSPIAIGSPGVRIPISTTLRGGPPTPPFWILLPTSNFPLLPLESKVGFQAKQDSAMDLLPQELLEEIIDHLPGPDAAASSLVSRRWRCRSQQRHFESICFFSAHQMVFWEANIPPDPDGIVSYVHHVRFDNTSNNTLSISLEPVTFGRILKSFESMVTLTMLNAKVPLPGELTGPVSLGEFGKGVTRLVLAHELHTPLTALISFIFSFPNLKELVFNDIRLTSYEPPPILPGVSKRGPLDLLVLWKAPEELRADLIQHRLASRTLCLNPYWEDTDKLVAISLDSIVTLVLFGMRALWTSRE